MKSAPEVGQRWRSRKVNSEGVRPVIEVVDEHLGWGILIVETIDLEDGTRSRRRRIGLSSLHDGYELIDSK